MKLDRLHEQDIPALLDLAREIGWGYNPDNWRLFMSLGVVLGHRDDGGRPISSAVMIKYGDSLRWLTSFIVSPRFQRRGLARALWEGLRAADAGTRAPIGLVSTEEGIPFYGSIGFKQVATLRKYVRVDGRGLSPSRDLAAAGLADLNAIAALDSAASGVARRSMLEGKLRSAVSARISRDGFAIAVMEGELLCIGPVVAPNASLALDLILAVAADHLGTIRLDLPYDQSDLARRLEERQFELEREPPVLSYGGAALPPSSKHYVAIAAQALA